MLKYATVQPTCHEGIVCNEGNTDNHMEAKLQDEISCECSDKIVKCNSTNKRKRSNDDSEDNHDTAKPSKHHGCAAHVKIYLGCKQNGVSA